MPTRRTGGGVGPFLPSPHPGQGPQSNLQHIEAVEIGKKWPENAPKRQFFKIFLPKGRAHSFPCTPIPAQTWPSLPCCEGGAN